MAIGALDSAIFADMFGTPPMREVFGDDAFLAGCIEVEAALARAQGRLGIIPAEAADAIMHAANALASHEALDLRLSLHAQGTREGRAFEQEAREVEDLEPLAASAAEMADQ
jgi:3-carboxy-cis,cis-muconate cycloisomerase